MSHVARHTQYIRRVISTPSSTFFVLLFTGFEQHFPIRFNDIFKRDFLYKIVRGILHKIDRVNTCSAYVFWDRGKTLTRFEIARHRSTAIGVCNCKHCERVYDQDTCQPHYSSTIKYIQVRTLWTTRTKATWRLATDLQSLSGTLCNNCNIATRKKTQTKTQKKPRNGAET